MLKEHAMMLSINGEAVRGIRSSRSGHKGFRPESVHPSGFPIYLSADQLAACDEYAAADPYAVAENLESPFQQRRVQCTLDLLRDALQCRAAFQSPQSAVSILDLACGKGFITAAIRAAFPAARVFGLDRSLTAIAHAASCHPDIEFAVADALVPPYPAASFDVVVCNNLWEHVPDPLRLLDGISRILRRPGFLVLSTPSRFRTENLVRILRGRDVEMLNRHHVTEYTVGQVREQLRFRGFHLVRIHSSPVSGGTLTRRVAHAAFRTLFSLFSAAHHLEATVFYLARLDA